MFFRKRRPSTAGTEWDAGPESPQSEARCPGLARALERILSKEERPEVLDLGQFCRSSAVYLADRGARVAVENFQPPEPAVVDASDVEPERSAPGLVIEQPEGKFDLVLAWEHPDFVAPERLAEFASEVHRVMAPGGWLVLYAQDRPGSGDEATEQPPGGYRLTADDRVVRESAGGPGRPRWSHPNRVLERALAPLSVQSIHLQPGRIREFLLQKPAAR